MVFLGLNNIILFEYCSDIFPLIISIKRKTRTSYQKLFDFAFVIQKYVFLHIFPVLNAILDF